MKTSDSVPDLLNKLLAIELTVTELYQRQSSMMAYWGVSKLATKFEEESLEERGHARQLEDRIVFLQGTIQPTYLSGVKDGTTVQEIMEESLRLETAAAKSYRKAVDTVSAESDHGTRLVLEKILDQTEEHVLWLEQQLSRLKLIGVQNFITEWS